MNRRTVRRGGGRHRQSGAAKIGATLAAPALPVPSGIDVPTFQPTDSSRPRKGQGEVRESELTSPTSRPVARRRHEKPRPAGYPRIVAAVALVGATAVVGGSYTPPPSEATGRVQRIASPNVQLAAVFDTFFGPVTILPTTVAVDPAAFSAAIAALAAGHTNTVATQMAGPNAVNIPLWSLPGSTGNAGAVVNSAGGPAGGTNGAASVLQTANQLGPLTYLLNNLGTISFSNWPDPTAPAGSRPVFHAADMTSWMSGLAGVANTAGTTGWIVNNTFGSSDGGVADVTGLLQTANNLGPLLFNLNVIKSLSFVQAPNGTVLPDGQLDAIRATDIGQWAFGIPGIFTNTGTTGFVADRGFGIEYGTAGWVGGLQTTTTIGSFNFTFDFLPAIGFGAPPPTMTPFASGPPPATLMSTADTSTGDDVTALRSAETQQTAEPSEAPVPEASVPEATASVNEASAASQRVSATAPAAETTTDPATTTATSPAANEKNEQSQISRRTSAETTDPAGATEPDAASDPGGARHSATSPNGATSNPGSGDTSVGRHRADNDSPSSQSGSDTSDSDSAG